MLANWKNYQPIDDVDNSSKKTVFTMSNYYGDYQSLPQEETNDYNNSDSIKPHSYVQIEQEENDSGRFFSKKVSFSSGFIMLGSCILLVAVGLLSLNVHPVDSGLSLKSSGGKMKFPKLEPCKTDCANPCGRFKVFS